jgi:predicted permease
MIRSFLKIYMADMGVSTENVLVMRVGLPAARYPDAAAQVSFFEQLTLRIEAHPGVESAGLANVVPTWRTRRLTYEVPDGRVDTAPTDEQRRPTVSLVVTAPGYFASLRASVTAGRDFEVFDNATGPPVVVVNERFAATTWPGEAAVGKRIRLFGAGSEDWRTVVGVVGNVAQNDATRQTIDPVVYVPHRQVPAPGMFVVARTRVAPETLVNDWRREVAALDSNLLATPTPLSQLLADTYQYRGITGAMFLVCAAIALLLAAVGLYAVMMHSVNQRTKEIGVRMAIGATTGDISRLVFRQGLFTLGVGLALGIATSMVVNRILVTSLVQVSPSDPGTYAVVCLLLTTATALGCWVPARRAMRVDPVLALQSQ